MSPFISSDMAQGHIIPLQRTDPRHIGGSVAATNQASAAPGGGIESVFGNLFFEALGQVNDLQLTAIERQQQMVLEPDSVDIHDVTIAIAEANLAIATAKQVSDAALRAYREIVNVR
jgi:flagellar hook-basal body complex protein FliE